MKYYEYLLNINKLVCKESKVRTANLYIFTIIEKAIDIAFISENDKSLLTNAMRVAALIKLFQPFSDGNHRTALIVFGNILNKKGFYFDYEKALEDMENHKLNIPTIYDENDKVSFPEQWYEYISDQKENTRIRSVG